MGEFFDKLLTLATGLVHFSRIFNYVDQVVTDCRMTTPSISRGIVKSQRRKRGRPRKNPLSEPSHAELRIRELCESRQAMLSRGEEIYSVVCAHVLSAGARTCEHLPCNSSVCFG